MTALHSTDRLWPRMIILSFLLLAVVQAFIAVLAYRSSVGVVEERPYEAGLEYETVLRERRAAQVAQMQFELLPRLNALDVTVSRPSPVEATDLTVTLVRPDGMDRDRSESIHIDSLPWTAHLEALRAGLWLVEVRVDLKTGAYRSERRTVIIPQ